MSFTGGYNDGETVELYEKQREKALELEERSKRNPNKDEKEIEKLKQSFEKALECFDGKKLTIGCVAIMDAKDIGLDSSMAVVFLDHRIDGVPLEMDVRNLKGIDELKTFSKVMFVSADAEMAKNILGKGLGHIVYENKNNGGVEVSVDIIDLFSPELGGKILKEVVNF